MASSGSFVMRLYHLDWYLAEPYVALGDVDTSIITSKPLSVCPVVRLYGHVVSADPDATVQCCVHVHGYYPKVLFSAEAFQQSVTERHFADGLEYVMSGSGGGQRGQLPPTIVDVKKVQRIDIYGYHETPENVFEVRYVDPGVSYKLAHAYKSLCARSGSNGKIFELHIPYTLQLVSEHGLAAGATVHFKADACFVRPTGERQSKSFLEVDVPCTAIHNPEEASTSPSYPSSARLSTSQPCSGTQPAPYPRPSPLSASQSADSTSMMCQRLRTLWRSEYERSLAEGVSFPYQPESRATSRPSPQSMPCHIENATRLEALRESIRSQEEAIDSASQGAYQTQKAALAELFEVVADADDPDKSPLPPLGPEPNEYAESVASGSSVGSDVGLVPMYTIPERETASEDTKESILAPRMNELYEFTPSPPSREALLAELDEAVGLSPKYLSAPKQGDRRSIDYCTLLYLEVVVQLPRGIDKWDPTLHPLVAVVCILRDQRQTPQERTWVGVIGDLLKEEDVIAIDPLTTVDHLSCESELILALDRIFTQFDPTVVISWDASRRGIVFIAERARALGLPGAESMFHRVFVPPVPGPMGLSTLHGRITLDLWQTLRQEDSLKLATTTLHGAAKQLLGLTLPRIPMWLLQEWWTDASCCIDAFKYTVRLCTLGLQLLDASALLSRASEMASVLGMPDVEEVLTRGSQYRVECILHRAASRTGFGLVSSSKAQVKAQPALEGVPMVLEPRSGYYRTPTIILDFQSLYPSIIIAYNMCFSTCLGRVEHQDLTVALGTQRDKPYTIRRSSSLLQDDNVVVAANGAVFVQPSCRVGILPRMLHEVLQTRFMVKRAMKSVNSGDSPALYRIMDARQLGLKLLANVTYGYAGASYSGRMPCSELADAIVMTARRTLQHAMSVAEDMGATVFYGDTDSMFIRPPVDHCGSVESAFEFGRHLADCVTSANPWPVKLQLEKVCMPCVLVSKKRYCGWAYEHPKASPQFFAKGIETVRRDSCPFTANSVRAVLEAMFRTDPRADEALHLEAGRRAGRDIIRRAFNGEISKVDFIFQNQVRLNYRSKNLPPAAHVALIQGLDTGYKERVAYVVARRVGDRSNLKLQDRVVPPYRLLGPRGLVLDVNYYLTKQFFPAVQRVLAPIVPNVAEWLSENIQPPEGVGSLECCTCHIQLDHRQGQRWLCDSCLERSPPDVVYTANERARQCEAKCRASRLVCMQCTEGSLMMATGCSDAYHCQNYFIRSAAPIAELRARRYLVELDNRLASGWDLPHSQSSSKRASTTALTEAQISQGSLLDDDDMLGDIFGDPDFDAVDIQPEEAVLCNEPEIPVEQSPFREEFDDLLGLDVCSDFSIEEAWLSGYRQEHQDSHDGDEVLLASWGSHAADSTLDGVQESTSDVIDSISLSDEEGARSSISDVSIEIIDCD